MKKVYSPNLTKGLSILICALLFNFYSYLYAQETAKPADTVAVDTAGDMGAAAAVTTGGETGDLAAGEALFKANCAACHKLDQKATGPALRGVAAKHDKQWLYKWIHNSQTLIKAGDAQAVALFAEHNQSVMTPFPQLSESDIDNIIAYTSQPKAEPTVAQTPLTGSTSGNTGGVSNDLVLGALALIFVLLIVMLFLVTNTLKRIAEANGVVYAEREKRTPIWKVFIQNQFLVLVTSIFLILAAGYFMYGYMMQVGVDQGYMPVQPIHYSHKIHAGANQIDCKYCHSSARKSKTSGIPSLNVCMNCHKNISEYNGDVDPELGYTKEFYDGEIQKLYNAVGWDVAEQKYTGKTEPVKWVRIHNLPDFAYFNHSQHVMVGGIECQKCHGPVEEYEVMKQFAPLTMGWCINCHRETNVSFAGNEYYDKIHEELSKKYGVENFTVADMGGIECGKCHY